MIMKQSCSPKGVIDLSQNRKYLGYMTTIRSRGIGAEVRKLRKDADLKLEELALRCGWSRATLGRVESGDKIPTETEIAIILGTLRITGDERTRLLELAQNAHQPHWWEVGYSGLPDQLISLLEFERQASKITNISLALVPGLLQTADYARAIVSAGGVQGDNLESRVSIRLGRQGALTRKEPVQFHAILDESVLLRPIGSAQVMAEQLRHILRMVRRPNITVQMVPFGVGAHAGLAGSHILLEFQRQRSIVHLEHLRSSVFLDDPAHTSLFFDAVPSLTDAALSPKDSVDLVAARAKAWEGHDESDRRLA
jgi:transcriptional regulator with XRE-family HTH domain